MSVQMQGMVAYYFTAKPAFIVMKYQEMEEKEDLTLPTVGNRLTNEQITIKIVNGGGNMPSFGASLTGKDLNDLTAFLLTRKN